MSFLFGSTSSIKARERTAAVKFLSEKMNASYTYGANSLKDKFNVCHEEEEKDGNVIFGSFDGYPYCFVEYFHIGKGKNDYSEWMSYCSLRLKSTCPDFEVSKITSAQSSSNISIVVGCILLIPTLFTLIFFFAGVFILYKGYVLNGLPFIIFSTIAFFFFGFFSYTMITAGLQTKREIKNQSKYDIRNHSFKDKYVILSVADPYKIKKIFTDEVCEGIVKARPEIDTIAVSKNCINMEFRKGEMLEYNSCNKCLNTLVSQANLFKLEEDNCYLD